MSCGTIPITPSLRSFKGPNGTDRYRPTLDVFLHAELRVRAVTSSCRLTYYSRPIEGIVIFLRCIDARSLISLLTKARRSRGLNETPWSD